MGAPRAGGRLVVASYNVHRYVGRDGVRDVGRIARVIESLDADVIALQEVEASRDDRETGAMSVDILGHLVGLHAISGPTIEHDHGHYGNAILTRLPVREVRRVDLTFHSREPRGALDVDLDVEGTEVRIIATHLGLRPRERRHQVQRILETVADQRQGLTVLLGDINEWLISGRPLRWLHRRFGQCRALPTFPAWFPLFALDRIWVHPQEAMLDAVARDTPEARIASDHLPVRAELALATRDAGRDDG
jgi:endonuclease/exonuclease/phosphatase family metal-dependent hydrolase